MIVEKYTNELVFGNKQEDIEGYEDAISSSEMYVPHHVLEWKYTVDELVAMNRYWQVDASELIWMSQSVHNNNSTLHKGVRLKNEAMKSRTPWNKGKTLSEEYRKKISESQKGKTLSDEHRQKLFESNKGKHRSEETRKKISESRKDKHLSDETRAKISAAGKGKHWYNNGIINMFAKSCPEGFVKGRLYGSKV